MTFPPPSPAALKPRLVLFVCTGNTCRSPMAEVLFRARMPSEAGWEAESAGLCAPANAPASAGAVEAIREIGLDAAPHRSRLLTPGLVDRADMLVVMTGSHRAELTRRFPGVSGRVRLLTSFSAGGEERDVADPVGQPVGHYRRCRDEIARSVSALVVTLMEKDAARRKASGGDAV